MTRTSITHEETLDTIRRNKARDAFQTLFAEWLTNRADYMRPDIDWNSDAEQQHGDREEELARLITTTPAVLPWMILQKFEVLEHYLGTEGGTRWSDNRELVMLAGIKADLLRFAPPTRRRVNDPLAEARGCAQAEDGHAVLRAGGEHHRMVDELVGHAQRLVGEAKEIAEGRRPPPRQRRLRRALRDLRH